MHKRFFLVVLLPFFIEASVSSKGYLSSFEASDKARLGDPVQVSIASQISWNKVQKKAEQAVVQVFSQMVEPNVLKPYRKESGEGRGTAFLISEQGCILTNYHVVAGATRVVIQMPLLFGKKMIEVDVKSVCPERDIALLKLRDQDCEKIKIKHGSIPYLVLGDSEKIDRSDELLALGFPLGQESLKSATGVVSGEEHVTIASGGGRTVEARCFQVSTPINPGNSGGPTLNRDGEVVGINTAGIGAAQNVGYILPISEYKLIEIDLRRKPLVKKPYLGATYCYAEGDELAHLLGNPVPSGCYLTKVYDYGLMHEFGLRSGDMIYSLNGCAVDVYGHVKVPEKDDRINISDFLSSLALGDALTIVMYRAGEEHILKGEVFCPEEPPISWKYFQYDNVDYEIVGGILLQELSFNILGFFKDPQVAQQVPNINTYLAQYALDESTRSESAVIVTQIFASSLAHRTRAIGLGEIITELNGKRITTLKEVREALSSPIEGSKFTTFKTRDEDLIALNTQEMLEDELRLSAAFNYTVTPHVFSLLCDRNIISASNPFSSLIKRVD